MKSLKFQYLLLFFSLFTFSFSVYSRQLSKDSQDRLSKLLESFDQKNAPGFVLKVIRDGEVLFEKNTGLANLETKEKNNDETVFRVASLSKQFTAACILLLEEKGLVNLDDPISLYFPSFPDYADEITIRHLIHHTSGLRDFFKLADLSGYNEDDFNSEEAVLNMIGRQKKLNFAPGEDMLYNNSGYFLLARIVKEVSGKSIGDFASDELFKPLGMSNTQFFNNETHKVKNRAYGYSLGDSDKYELNESNLMITGDGGLFTTANDMVKWLDNFYVNKLPITDFADRMYTKGKLNDGTELSYAFGLEHADIMGMDCIEHSGAYVGFRSALINIPQKKLSIVCLGNLSNLQPEQICRKVAEIVLEEGFKKPEVTQERKPLPFERRAINIPEKTFEIYSGKYELGNGQILQFYTENNRYYVDIIGQTVIELFPESIMSFFVKETDLSFSFITDKEGNAIFSILSINNKRLLAKRVNTTTGMNNKEMVDYVGAYYNEELDVVYKLMMLDKKLFIQIGNKPFEEIGMIKQDKMILGEGMAEFHRDGKGKVASFLLEAGSVKDLLFVKR
ncbi:MAG: hypothetical protein CMO01_04895 [Thalassobius sp.]|nr:hypothetical protein [Thalassovita sp.]